MVHEAYTWADVYEYDSSRPKNSSLTKTRKSTGCCPTAENLQPRLLNSKQIIGILAALMRKRIFCVKLSEP